jgi:gastrin-releasing peptide receptor/bombesin-like receptor 3
MKRAPENIPLITLFLFLSAQLPYAWHLGPSGLVPPTEDSADGAVHFGLKLVNHDEELLNSVNSGNASVVVNNISSASRSPWTQNVFSNWNTFYITNKISEDDLNVSEEDKFYTLKMYVNPSIYILIMTVGLVQNGTLVLIFLRHKEIRTTANIMLFNLAVSDILNLGISAPLFCMFHYPHNDPADVTLCRLYTAGRHFLLCVSALSVLALSVQRFCITAPKILYSRSNSWSLTTSPMLYVFAVWLLAFLIALPMLLSQGVYGYLCSSSTDESPTRVLFLLYALMFCVLLPSLMLFFSMLTARRLRKSAVIMPCALRHITQAHARVRSASIVTFLALVFVLTYFPLWLWAAVVYWTDPDRQSVPVLVSEYVTKYLLFANGCFNPTALCIASRTFRNLFRRYLCCSAQPVETKQSDM